MQVTVNFEGSDFLVDLDQITVGEARTIKRNIQMGLSEFSRGCFVDGDPDALVWLYWLMKKQNGDNSVDPNRVDFRVAQFAAAVITAYDEAAKKLEREAGSEGEDSPKEQ